ncbi:hypothetical protein GYMLUDRAFT_44610 [Collybiopsis luxurians FD-317 M1]|uniref:Uncharacterized protein n=1 Tax=Collybiopsis luxurians FD-317 M1 TaxID=944289 RepID=A0A0D0C9R0_9AGAR|nr:hypothetical protein GYMLUDRAFT_44610 [Collybiopsis luxurians FD-317 M1]
MCYTFLVCFPLVLPCLLPPTPIFPFLPSPSRSSFRLLPFISPSTPTLPGYFRAH